MSVSGKKRERESMSASGSYDSSILSEVDDRHGGDANSHRLMAKIVDTLDVLLVKHGFAKRESSKLALLVAGLESLIYAHYEDETGGDSSYVPSESGTPESEESVSASLEDEEEEAEE